MEARNHAGVGATVAIVSILVMAESGAATIRLTMYARYKISKIIAKNIRCKEVLL